MDTNEPHVRLHEIAVTADPCWPQWKAIYDAAFDECERFPDSFYLEMLDNKSRGEATNVSLLVAECIEQPGVVVAMADLVWLPVVRAVLLRYFATKEGLRGRGIGRSFYSGILARCRTMGADLMIFEVEIPEIMAARSEVEGDMARRRIQWYLRQGARLLAGIHYDLVMPGIPAMEMRLMAHTLGKLTAHDVFDAAKAVFGDALEQTGEVGLEN